MKGKLKLYRRSLAAGMKLIRNFELVKLNEPVSFEEPVIYVANHSSMHDVPVAIEYLKDQFKLLAGKENLDFQAKTLFCFNGVVYVDRKDKKNKDRAKQKCIHYIKIGKNLLVFPEGTWNLDELKIMLKMHFGVVEMSKVTDAPIVPFVMEYTMDKCYVKMGNPITFNKQITKEDLIDGIEQVASSLGSLRWDVWEHIGIQSRETVTKEDFDTYKKKRLDEYKIFNEEFERSVILKLNEDKIEHYDEILNRITIDRKNAFLLNQRDSYEKVNKREKTFVKGKKNTTLI